MYQVRWTENNRRRVLKFTRCETARLFLNRLILDCGCYDAVLGKVKEKPFNPLPVGAIYQKREDMRPRLVKHKITQ